MFSKHSPVTRPQSTVHSPQFVFIPLAPCRSTEKECYYIYIYNKIFLTYFPLIAHCTEFELWTVDCGHPCVCLKVGTVGCLWRCTDYSQRVKKINVSECLHKTQNFCIFVMGNGYIMMADNDKSSGLSGKSNQRGKVGRIV